MNTQQPDIRPSDDLHDQGKPAPDDGLGGGENRHATGAVVVQPGDRVLLFVDSPVLGQADRIAERLLGELAPGVEFSIVPGYSPAVLVYRPRVEQ